MSGMTETSAGATAARPFTVPVIPESMPCFVFSGKPRDTGQGPWLAVNVQ